MSEHRKFYVKSHDDARERSTVRKNITKNESLWKFYTKKITQQQD